MVREGSQRAAIPDEQSRVNAFTRLRHRRQRVRGSMIDRITAKHYKGPVGFQYFGRATSGRAFGGPLPPALSFSQSLWYLAT
jgi:hypothetical protein